MVPLFSSSTEWWILPSCYRDRYAQCQTVRCRRHPCRGADADSHGPVTTEILHLQCIDKVVVQFLQFGCRRVETVEIPQLQPVSWTRSFTRPLCATTDALVDVLAQFIDSSHVPVIMQRRLLSGSAPDSVFAGDSGHSTCATENEKRLAAVLFKAAMKGFSTHFASFFALFQLSRS